MEQVNEGGCEVWGWIPGSCRGRISEGEEAEV